MNRLPLFFVLLCLSLYVKRENTYNVNIGVNLLEALHKFRCLPTHQLQVIALKSQLSVHLKSYIQDSQRFQHLKPIVGEEKGFTFK